MVFSRELKFFTFTLASLLAIAIGAEGLTRVFYPHPAYIQESFDIQSAATLYTKFMETEATHRPRIYVFGDSSINGMAMDVKDWRERSLDKDLERDLALLGGPKAVQVTNLAAGGATGADLASLAQSSLAAHPDVVVVGLNLEEFAFRRGLEEGYTRSFLRYSTIEDDLLRFREGVNLPLELRIEAGLDQFLVNHSLLYRYAHTWSWYLYETTAGDHFGLELKNRLISFTTFATHTPNSTPPEVQPGSTPRERYFETLDWTDKNSQVKAFKELLDEVVARRQPVVLFYARESERIVVDPVHAENLRHVREGFTRFLAPYCRTPTIICEFDKTVPEERYLDRSHVDARGMQEWSKILAPLVLRAWTQRSLPTTTTR